MNDAIDDKVAKVIEQVENQYHRLVLVVGESGSGKTLFVKRIAKNYGTKLVNLNLFLAKELLDMTLKQRRLMHFDIMSELLKDKNQKVFLDNIEILFDPQLKQDPLRLLKKLSRNKTIISTWNGNFNDGILTYAVPGHHEYREYRVTETQIIDISEK